LPLLCPRLNLRMFRTCSGSPGSASFARMDPQYPAKKKGLGGLAWLGIGCGGAIFVIVVLGVLVGMFFGPRLKEMLPQLQQMVQSGGNNPTRLAANIMITMGGGKFEMAAEDDEHKRYTVRVKDTGKLVTLYWDEKTKSVKNVPGDFSAIPADASGTPAPQ